MDYLEKARAMMAVSKSEATPIVKPTLSVEKEAAVHDDWNHGDPIAWDDSPLPFDCSQCGKVLDAWEEFSGLWHCKACDPPTKSLRMLRVRERMLAKIEAKQRRRGA